MKVQVLVAMGQDQLSKDKSGELLDQCVYVVAMTQDLRHSNRKYVRLTRDYLGTEGPLLRVMATWPSHIDCFKRQYNKSFTGHHPFGAYIVERIHKQVQVFFHFCNTTSLEDTETGSLAYFWVLQRHVKRYEWITLPPLPPIGRDVGAKERLEMEIRNQSMRREKLLRWRNLGQNI